MPATKYSHLLTVFPQQRVALDRLALEIRQSGIVTALDFINLSAVQADIWFKDALAGGDVTLLTALVAAHSGEPLPDNTLLKVQQYTSEGVLAPVAADGKPYVLPNSFPGEVLLNFAGISDELSPPTRFGGDLFGISQVGVGTTEFIVDFLDGVFLAGGHVDWDGGSWGSSIQMNLWAPATTTKAPVVANQGNCNKVPTGLGFNILVPAAGDGVYDLDVPVPIPAYEDETNAQMGYWGYSEPWVGRGTVSPAATPVEKYNLFDAPLELAHFTVLHLFLETGQRDLIAPAIKPKWILPEWKIKIALNNVAGNKTLRAGWDLLVARRKTI